MLGRHGVAAARMQADRDKLNKAVVLALSGQYGICSFVFAQNTQGTYATLPLVYQNHRYILFMYVCISCNVRLCICCIVMLLCTL